MTCGHYGMPTLTHSLTAAPSGIVASLRVTATSTTSVTIEWGRVPCRDRNAEITQYVVVYVPVFGGQDMAIVVSNIRQTNNAIITGLIPRTAYAIHVRANHIRFSMGSFLLGTMHATVNATTSVPEGKVPVYSLYSSQYFN